MNAERLLALYEQVAEAPDAVPRLRRFVLDLAVRGKLVPHDTSEGQGTVLLKQIAYAWKARLASGEIKKIKKWPKVSAEDVPFDVPSNWALVRLGEAMDLINGRAFKPSDWTQEGLPIVRIQNLNNASAPFNRFDGEVRPRFLIDTGDFLISWSGTPGTSFGAHIWDRGSAVLNQHIFKAMLLGEAFEKAFLKIAINSRLLELIEQAHGGVGLQHITKPKLESVALTLPPLAEQRRIVAKVEELMALLDRLEAARKAREDTRDRLTAASLARLTAPDPEASSGKVGTGFPSGSATNKDLFPANARFAFATLPALTTRPDQIKPLRQTILNLAVRGKLVEQDPTDEPASELLKRIASDKKERAVSARDRRAGAIKPLDGTDLPFDLLASWHWVAFGDITISRDGERVPVSKAERENRAKIYDYYGASGVIDKIDGYLFDKPLLLIGEDGANLINRSTPIAFIARGKYWVNNHAHVLDGLNEQFLRYLELFINATDLKPFVTGTAQPKMNQAKMNSIPVALPPLAEQHRIVAKVDALMALCDRLEAALTTADTTRARLLEALLHEALDPAAEAVTEAAE